MPLLSEKWRGLFKKENRYIFSIGFAVAGFVSYIAIIRPMLRQIDDRKIERQCAEAFRKRYPELVAPKSTEN